MKTPARIVVYLLWIIVLPSVESCAQSEVPLIEADALQKLVQEDNSVVVLDTRSPEEYQSGHLENARFVNYATFQLSDVQDIPLDSLVVVYCLSGGRSGRVAQQLLKAGYQDVKNLNGGIRSWQTAGFNVEKE
ncbi:rhodanese-like domain-containing protein [Tunicatimonas pelagia]|uniref:rhodanese-like domain-containing protein n=1 Tax=Tunicatimonas pelagia TaxID=931531 RepID=UPI0026670418|nr:rhodanese-like domain-containing protein [Tunicatimonas pelagia]WKN44118.1 rhodanese-like domain-containing protein [Tunicatimonas pelagia]